MKLKRDKHRVLYLGWNNPTQQDSVGVKQTESGWQKRIWESLWTKCGTWSHSAPLQQRQPAPHWAVGAWSRGRRLRDMRMYLEHSVHFWILQYINKQDWVQRRPQRWWGSWSSRCMERGWGLGLINMEKGKLQKRQNKRADGVILLSGTQWWAVDTSWNMGNSN